MQRDKNLKAFFFKKTTFFQPWMRQSLPFAYESGWTTFCYCLRESERQHTTSYSIARRQSGRRQNFDRRRQQRQRPVAGDILYIAQLSSVHNYRTLFFSIWKFNNNTFSASWLS